MISPILQDRVHANHRVHHVQTIRDTHKFSAAHPPHLHRTYTAQFKAQLVAAISSTPAFLPLRLTATEPEPAQEQIKAELRKGALSMHITWPISAATQFASWASALVT